MTDLLLLPPPKRSRSRRLRKKLRIGEFQMLGFEYELIWRSAPTIDMQDRFVDQLLEEIIEPRGLSLGGGLNCGFIAARRGSVTQDDRAAFDRWVRCWSDLLEIQIGPLRDAWYDEAPGASAIRSGAARTWKTTTTSGASAGRCGFGPGSRAWPSLIDFQGGSN